MSTQTRKLVLIAGSSGYFGFASEEFAGRLPVTPVNYSLHFTWPLEYSFSAIKPHLHAGDIVLLCLEYEYYPRPTRYTAQFVGEVMNFETDHFWKLQFVEKIRFMTSVSPERLLGGLLAKLYDQRGIGTAARIQSSALSSPAAVLRAWQAARGNEQYSPCSIRLINEYGDLTADFGAFDLGKVSYAVTKPFVYSDYTWSAIGEFARWCRDHGIIVYATWPPTIKDPGVNFEKAIPRAHVNALVENYRIIGIPVLGDPQYFQFERDWFGDNRYHLRREGRRERSRRVASLPAYAVQLSQDPAHTPQ